MNDELGQIIVSTKTGEEQLSLNNCLLNYKLLDFWRWSASDLTSNALRGIFAEFIVGTAIGVDFRKLREEWAEYDIEDENGIKIEVKSAAYIQTWKQKAYSTVSFSIKSKQLADNTSTRHADVYVFCLLKHKIQAELDPTKLEQWAFYVLSTQTINNLPNKSSIGLSTLEKLTLATNYSQLKHTIQKIYEQNEIL